MQRVIFRGAWLPPLLPRVALLTVTMILGLLLAAGAALADTVFSTSDSPTTKEDCKNGGYAKYGFKNQGRCIEAVTHATPADTTAPQVTFTQGPEHQSSTQADSVTFAWEANEPITSRCSVDYKSPEAIQNGGQPVYLENNVLCQSPKTLSNLEEGMYHFLVRGTDQAGNDGFMDRTFYVDRSGPTVNPRAGVTFGDPSGAFEDGATIYPVARRPDLGVAVMFDPIVTSSEPSQPVTFECRTDAPVVGDLVNQWVDCMQIRHVEGLSAGSYTYDVRATDALGNASITTTHFTVAPLP
jgi:hypothetical protein